MSLISGHIRKYKPVELKQLRVIYKLAITTVNT